MALELPLLESRSSSIHNVRQEQEVFQNRKNTWAQPEDGKTRRKMRKSKRNLSIFQREQLQELSSKSRYEMLNRSIDTRRLLEKCQEDKKRVLDLCKSSA